MPPGPVRKWIRRIWIAAGLSFTAWLAWNLQAHGVPAAVTETTSTVTVTVDGSTTYFVAAAADGAPRPVVVFLPGGLVAPRAYLPVVRAIAESATSAALVELPYRSAFTEAQRQGVWAGIRTAHARLGASAPLVVAGHSRGAALAARFAATHADAVSGLILIGTTHPREDDLSSAAFPVLKIAGTRDCVAPLDDARANAGKLPARTEWVVIEGANHAQFGFYGSQINDCGATLSREAQQRQLIDAVMSFVDRR